MTVVQDPNQQDPNQQQGQQQTGNVNVSGTSASGPGGYKGATGSNPSGTGMSSAPAIGGGAANNGGGIPNAATNSGSYQNLQNYVDANQNYTNQGGLAGQISNDYQNGTSNLQGANQIQNNINSAGNNWYTQNSSKDVNPDQASSYVNQAVANPTQYTDPNSVSQFQGYLGAANNYVAPTGFDPSQLYQNQVQNYQGQVANLGTSTGRQAALQSLYANPYYSQGQGNLDNLILSQGVDANGVNQLQQLQNNTQGYAQGLQNAYNGVASGINGTYDPTLGANTGGALQQYATDAAATQANTQGALGNAITGLYNQYANNIPTLEAQRDNAFGLVQQTLGNGQITPQMISQFGIDPSQQLWGINAGASPYLTESTLTPTVGNTISSSDQATMNAYNTLAGTLLNTANSTASTDLSNLHNNTYAGTFANAPQYTFDNNAYNTALGKQQGNYQQSLQNIISNLNAGLSNDSDHNAAQQLGTVAVGAPINFNPNPQNDIFQINSWNGTNADSNPAQQNDLSNAEFAIQNLLNQYGQNNPQTWQVVPNLVGTPATTGPSIGQNNTPITKRPGGFGPGGT